MPKKWECRKCARKFKRAAHLEIHKKACEKNAQKEFQWEHCGKGFLWKKSLAKHQKVVSFFACIYSEI